MIFPLLLLAVLHPVHETTSEIQWNGETARLEVAFRLDLLDEQWLDQRWSRGRKHDVWAVECLRQSLRITEPPLRGRSDPTKYHWVGRQEEGAHVWWYFEIETAAGRPPSWIEQQMFAKHKSAFTHRILVLGEGPDQTLVLNNRQRRGKLTLSD